MRSWKRKLNCGFRDSQLIMKIIILDRMSVPRKVIRLIFKMVKFDYITTLVDRSSRRVHFIPSICADTAVYTSPTFFWGFYRVVGSRIQSFQIETHDFYLSNEHSACLGVSIDSICHLVDILRPMDPLRLWTRLFILHTLLLQYLTELLILAPSGLESH